MAFDLNGLLVVLKPVIKKFVDEVAIPEVIKLEDKIGNEAVKHVVEALTKAAGDELDKLLS